MAPDQSVSDTVDGSDAAADDSEGGDPETVDSERGDSREQGVDIGPLADALGDHSYPATTAELVAAYGDYEIELPGETRTLADVLGRLEGDEVTYESADEVRRMVYNLVGSAAVGREGYSDRGGVTRETVGDDGEST